MLTLICLSLCCTVTDLRTGEAQGGLHGNGGDTDSVGQVSPSLTVMRIRAPPSVATTPPGRYSNIATSSQIVTAIPRYVSKPQLVLNKQTAPYAPGCICNTHDCLGSILVYPPPVIVCTAFSLTALFYQNIEE